MLPQIKRLNFRCPAPIREAYPAIPDECFELIGSTLYLKLWVGRGKYTPTDDQEEMSYTDTAGGTIAPVALSRVGFEAVIEMNFTVKRLVEHLQRNCLSPNRRSHTPIQVLDFCDQRHTDPVLFHNGEPYTVRSGRIVSIQGQGASVGVGSILYGDGFTIRFKEQRQRAIG